MNVVRIMERGFRSPSKMLYFLKRSGTYSICVHLRVSSTFRRQWKTHLNSFLIKVQNVNSSHIQLKSEKRSGRLEASKKSLKAFCAA